MLFTQGSGKIIGLIRVSSYRIDGPIFSLRFCTGTGQKEPGESESGDELYPTESKRILMSLRESLVVILFPGTS